MSGRETTRRKRKKGRKEFALDTHSPGTSYTERSNLRTMRSAAALDRSLNRYHNSRAYINTVGQRVHGAAPRLVLNTENSRVFIQGRGLPRERETEPHGDQGGTPRKNDVRVTSCAAPLMIVIHTVNWTACLIHRFQSCAAGQVTFK